MSWDENRVRIELGQVMTVAFGAQPDLAITYAAEIWPFVDGKAKGRKPAARILEDSVPALLRNLADWIDEHDDPGLRFLIRRFEQAKENA
jgi:hypothetical protein